MSPARCQLGKCCSTVWSLVHSAQMSCLYSLCATQAASAQTGTQEHCRLATVHTFSENNQHITLAWKLHKSAVKRRNDWMSRLMYMTQGTLRRSVSAEQRHHAHGAGTGSGSWWATGRHHLLCRQSASKGLVQGEWASSFVWQHLHAGTTAVRIGWPVPAEWQTGRAALVLVPTSSRHPRAILGLPGWPSKRAMPARVLAQVHMQAQAVNVHRL